jgi:hypothetical protein
VTPSRVVVRTDLRLDHGDRHTCPIGPALAVRERAIDDETDATDSHP